MDNHAEKSGSRASTRDRVVEVFNRLLLEGATPRPKVAEVLAEAGVSRSTFYDHFDGIEALSNESLAGLFAALAECVIDGDDDARLEALLDHVWQNRKLGRELLTGERGERSQALLANELEKRLADTHEKRISAILIAGTVFSALAGWVTGRLSTPPGEMAASLRNVAAAVLKQHA